MAEKNIFGALSKYANKNLIPLENTAWKNAAVKKYRKMFSYPVDNNRQNFETESLIKETKNILQGENNV